MKTTAFERISRNKSFLMGLAILWMVLFHSAFTFSGKSFYLPLQYLLKFVGYGSVDIFMLLSGFGLYCSLSRNGDAVRFYEKRARRLLPSYLLLILPWALLAIRLDAITLPEIAGNLTCTGWWLGLEHQFNWYAQAIWAFYLITPVLFALMNGGKRPWLRGVLLVCFGFFLGVAFTDKNQLMAVSRVPVYLTGMLFGKAYLEKKSLSPWIQAGLVLLACGGILLPSVFNSTVGQGFMWTYGMWWYPFFLVTPGLCLALSCLGDGLRRCFLRPVVTGVEKLGACTFEIYLVQIAVYDYANRLIEQTTLTMVLTLLVTIAAGILLKKLADLLMGLLTPKAP